jgi:chorismate synthase
MSGSTFGKLFKVSTFGESHGGCVGVVLDGCPAGLQIDVEYIQKQLDRRKPGQSALTTPRKEEDQIEISSGVFEGKTTGTPILMLARNKDMRSQDYTELSQVYRPSHADYTYQAKYGLRDFRGSGRASARETLARVAAGAVAQKYLAQSLGINFVSYVSQIGGIKCPAIDSSKLRLQDIEASLVRCPDAASSDQMIKLVEEVRDAGDSIGGVITGIIQNVPVGLGEPVFDKLHAELGKAMLSINAVKGFEIGSGFECAGMRGSEHNDSFYKDASGKVRTRTNFAGGVLGGISTGEDIVFRVAFKPVATISLPQKTLNLKGDEVDLEARGRHDPCVLPRAVPIVDAMAALVIMDFFLRFKAQQG